MIKDLLNLEEGYLEDTAMAQNQKLKLLRLLQILKEKTDETHWLSAADLITELEKYGIEAERKSIYKDIEAIEESGVALETVKGKYSGYHIVQRDFELAELKLLVDAVQSSKFITQKKSFELITKLSKLASVYDAKMLTSQISILNRPKASNETIFYNVSSLYDAIYNNSQITFHYSEWTMEKKLRFKKNGELYQVSPWALMWGDENYYMVAYDSVAGKIKHYRVDKMRDITETKDAREGKEVFEGFDLAEYSKKTFNMFGGKDRELVISGPNTMVGIFLDRFGSDIMIVPAANGRFRAHVKVSVSKPFFGWLCGIGSELVIEEPEDIRNQYLEHLQSVMDAMKKGREE